MANRHLAQRASLTAGLLLACFILTACEDRREPVKPKVTQAHAGAPHARV